jgi:hypothetical protein
MQNELIIKLKSVESEIIAIENGMPESEVITCGSEDFKDGYLHALFGMREWLEDMIANCE